MSGLSSVAQDVIRDAGWRLDWAHGSARVSALGGMLGPVDFRLPDGRIFQPFYQAPWQPDPALPPILQQMHGEWPCVPFTRNQAPEQLPPGWRELPGNAPQRSCEIHGAGANRYWQAIEQAVGRLLLDLHYPEDSPIVWLRREIRADPHAARVLISLEIMPRATLQLPIALHPTFRMAGNPGSMRLDMGTYRSVHTYPLPFEQASRLPPGVSAARLEALPAVNGSLDLTRLPLLGQTEELVQVKDCSGQARLDYLSSGVRVVLDWDPAQLPDCVLWVSNGGRPHAPWLGRNYALGIEPVNGLFELGGVVEPESGHPLAQRRGIALQQGIALKLNYSIGVELIP